MFLQQGEAFSIDASGTLLNRSRYDSEAENFTYYSDDTGEVFFKNARAGDWSAGYVFGTNLVRLSDAQVIVGNSSNLPEARNVTGDVKLSSVGVTSLIPRLLENKHFKDLTPATSGGRNGHVLLWDTLVKNWIYTDTKSLTQYGLLDDWGLYYDAANDHLGRGTKVPNASFDVAKDIATKNIVVRKTLTVSGAVVFNNDQGNRSDDDFLVKSDGESHMLFVQASSNRVGFGTATPQATVDVNGVFQAEKIGLGVAVPLANLDVRGTAIFNDAAASTSDLRIESRLDDHLVFTDASADRVGIGATAPTEKLDVRGDVVFNGDSGDYDFRVEGQSEVNLLFTDANTDRVGIGTAVPQVLFDVRGASVFNAGADNYDVRVVGQTEPNLLYVDASTDRVGLGVATPVATLDVRGTGGFNLGERLGSTFRVVGQKRSPSDADTISLIFVDVDNHRVRLGTVGAPAAPGSLFEVVKHSDFNSEGGDNDFRVQGDNVDTLIFVDASTDRVGIGTNTPDVIFDVAESAEFNSEGGDNDFRVRGVNDTLIFVDAGTDRVAVNTETPLARFHATYATDVGLVLDLSTTGVENYMGFENPTGTPMRLGTWGRGAGIGSQIGLLVQTSNATFGSAGEVAYFGADGRVGIGTTSPSKMLHTVHDTEVGIVLDKGTTTAGNNQMWFDNPTGTPMRLGTWRGVGLEVQDGLVIEASDATFGRVKEVAYFGADGRVGIGTTSPMAAFHVVDTTGVGILLDKSTTAAGNNHIWFDNPTGTPMRLGTWRGVGVKVQDGLVVETSNAAFGKVTEVMYFGADGRVGVSTTSPTEALDVRGNAVFNENAADEDFRIVGRSDANLFFADASTDRVGIGINIPDVMWHVERDAVFNSARGGNDFRIQGDNVDTLFFADASTDHVGIGTGVPSASLDVAKDAVFNSSRDVRDFRIQSDNIVTMVASDASTGRLGLNTSLPNVDLDVIGGAVFNGASGDNDFRIAGSSEPNLFFVDASTNRVGIGTNTPLTRFYVDHTDDVGMVMSKSTTTAGSNFVWFNTPTGTPMRMGTFRQGTGVTQDGFYVQTTNTSGRTSVRTVFYVGGNGRVGIGTDAPEARLGVVGSTVINSNSVDADFRVEGDTDQNLLFADASTDRIGIGTASPAVRLHVAHGGGIGLRITSAATSAFLLFKMPTTSSFMTIGVRGGSLAIDEQAVSAGAVNNPNNRMTVTSGGRVGIGTRTPGVPLHVVGRGGALRPATYTNKSSSGSAVPVGTYARNNGASSSNYWSRFSVGGRGSLILGDNGNDDNINDSKRSLLAIIEGSVEIHGGSIVLASGSVGVTYSDSRIKKDIETVDAEKSLKVLEKIRMISYKMRDTLEYGRQRFEGVLAQEIEKIDPSFVAYRTGYLPGIYRSGKVISYGSGVLELEVYNRVSDTEAVPGDEVRIYVTENELKQTKIEVKLLSKKVLRSGNTSLRFKAPPSEEVVWENVKEAFVYGKKVDDFRTVKYEKIYQLNAVVTQGLLKDNDMLKKEFEQSEKQLMWLKEKRQKHTAVREDMNGKLKAMERLLEDLKSRKAK